MIKSSKMKKLELKSRKLLRRIFNGISLTAVVFIFQACYGMPDDRYYDVKLSGTVTSKTTNLPIKGIKISVDDGVNYGFSDENGKFNFYASVPDCKYSRNRSVNVHFLDIDGVKNGHFSDKTIVIEPACKDEVRVNVELEEKE
jgi:hypothetical protein